VHKLTDDRMKWGLFALLAGGGIGLLASPLGPHLLFLIGLLGPAVVWCIALPSLDWKPYVLGLFAHQIFAWAGLTFFWGGLLTWVLSRGIGHGGEMPPGDALLALIALFLPVTLVSGVLFAVGGGLYRLSRNWERIAPPCEANDTR
jgi:hypothetical protein